MSSTRLPGKVLKSSGGITILDLLLKRLKESSKIDKIILAISDESSDDQLESWATRNSVPFIRGSLEDVALRFAEALKITDSPYFIRICADRPFLDPKIIDETIDICAKESPDIVTNTFPSSYPKGQTVEIISREVFLNTQPLIKIPYEKEHVTQYFYKNKDNFKIINYSYSSDLSSINMCVDTQEDYDRFIKVALELGDKAITASWEEILPYYKGAQ